MKVKQTEQELTSLLEQLAQHASALTGCKQTALATNVIANEQGVRRDAYTEVADKALDLVLKSTSANKEYFIKCLTENGRKYAKRPTMISIYGGTLQAFANYTLDSMKELNNSPLATRKASFELASFIKKAIETKLAGGKKFETWIQKCASIISKNNTGMTWTTPDGFKVVLNRKKFESVRIDVRLDGKKVKLNLNTPTTDLDKGKVKSSVSPNMVHSLDATHLRMTMLRCLEQGVSQFNLIHDSVGTTMNSGSIMYSAVRATWIDLYGNFSVANDIREQLQEQTETELPESPFLGGYEIDNVINSQWFFS